MKADEGGVVMIKGKKRTNCVANKMSCNHRITLSYGGQRSRGEKSKQP